MAKDPICGMTVDESSGLRAERDGQVFHFCSEHCRQIFLAQAPSTTGPPGSISQPKPPIRGEYYCPMCPGVISDQPGACPKCGMALERNASLPAAEKVIYTCPIHPEIQRDEPGTCPKCGMDLELEQVESGREEDDPELRAMTRRFWGSVVLGLPVFLLAMLPMLGRS